MCSWASLAVDFLRAKNNLVVDVRSYDDDDEKEASKARSKRYVPFLPENQTTLPALLKSGSSPTSDASDFLS